MAENLQLPEEGGLREPPGVPAKRVAQGVRRGLRLVLYSVKTWLSWARRALKFIIIAALLVLVERRLLDAWRREGLRALRVYVPLLLYVHTRLLLDARVPRSAKVGLGFGLVYGVVAGDLLPDRVVLPGLIDDVFVIGLTVQLFRNSCERAVVEHWARKAVAWRERATLAKGAPQLAKSDLADDSDSHARSRQGGV